MWSNINQMLVRPATLISRLRSTGNAKSLPQHGTRAVRQRLCQTHSPCVIMSASSSSYNIVVKTGDRKKAGTDANIRIVLHGACGQKTSPAKLDNLFRDDFERGRTDNFTVRDDVDVRSISKIEMWRDKAGVASEWYVDTIEVRNEASPCDIFMFPIYRWVKANFHYSILHLDTFLPQDDPNPDQRHMEIADKRTTYEVTQKVKGATAQVGQLQNGKAHDEVIVKTNYSDE
ncbi:Allene oxide synthase-lipoxygenase protein [Mizuhopecten yessoensis]|uniref:Allene oxide synthase-lipoxygenase protein n=1 Tax=Mizuhopecten yessoensis TaxID=6573 RepID=A0A210Q643_MIZYE|nr:Allene oxide synthase-lipoxygenase protein [Mizuhopecten yessoensis]